MSNIEIDIDLQEVSNTTVDLTQQIDGGIIDLNKQWLDEQLEIHDAELKEEWEEDDEVLDGKITALTTRVGTAENNITNLITRSNTFERQVETNTSNISTLNTSVSGIDSRVTTNTTDISNINSLLSGIDSRVTTNTTDISNINSSLSGVDTRITANAQEISTLNDTVSGMSETVTSDHETLETITPTIESLGTTYAAIDHSHKTSELDNDSNFVSDDSYVHTDNNYTSADQTKVSTCILYTTQSLTAAQKSRARANIGAGTSSISVDSAMSTTSTNPVQNKVITTRFNTDEDKISNIEDRLKYTYSGEDVPINFETFATAVWNHEKYKAGGTWIPAVIDGNVYRESPQHIVEEMLTVNPKESGVNNNYNAQYLADTSYRYSATELYNILTPQQISASDYFANGSDVVSDFTAYKMGNIINVQRYYFTKSITAGTNVYTGLSIKTAYLPKGKVAMRIMANPNGGTTVSRMIINVNGDVTMDAPNNVTVAHVLNYTYMI